LVYLVPARGVVNLFSFYGWILLSDKKNTGSDAAGGVAILLVLFAGVFALFWHYQGTNIKDNVRWLRIGQIWVASMLVDEDKYMISYNGLDVPLKAVYESAKVTPKEQLSSDAMGLISVAAMTPYKYIATAILLVLGFWALFYGPKSQFRRVLDLNHLIKQQSGAFTPITPFVSFNPSTQPPRPPGAPVPAELPSFAEALGPEEWIAYYDVPVPDGKVDAEAAARAFGKQLGAPWKGPLHMKPYRQILLAAFCLKSLRKRTESDSMLGRLAACWTFQKGFRVDSRLLNEARSILKNRDMSGKILSKCNQHAYENTAMLRALATAREEGGVLAPAQFVWMRGYDRALWYPLNNLGRQAYHMEALGAMCHYKAEKTTQRPIPRPKMEDAVKSISEYIASPNARPIPPLAYGKDGKRGVKKVKGT
jgi:intracellular multiplication protein IcmP